VEASESSFKSCCGDEEHSKGIIIAQRTAQPTPHTPSGPTWRFRCWLTTYRQLFAACLAINIVLLCLAATGHFEWGKENAGTLTSLTFLCAVLTRNEIWMRGIWWLTVRFATCPIVYRLVCSLLCACLDYVA
jgi:hypothetical protein